MKCPVPTDLECEDGKAGRPQQPAAGTSQYDSFLVEVMTDSMETRVIYIA